VDGIVHYCVANMPGGVARTSTLALTNATLPFILALADKGWHRAALDDRHLAAGVNIHAGRITHPAVADALGRRLPRPCNSRIGGTSGTSHPVAGPAG